jgi:hypothetical protein
MVNASGRNLRGSFFISAVYCILSGFKNQQSNSKNKTGTQVKWRVAVP